MTYPFFDEEARRQYQDVIRYTDDGKPYTTAEFDARKDPDIDRRRRRLAEIRGEDPDYVEPFPEPEQTSTPVDPSEFPPRSGIRQIINLLPKHGWELRRLTRARGPYVGSKGEVLSISESIVLGAVGPLVVDRKRRAVVASWRDGKFDFALALEAGGPSIRVNTADLKDWIKT